jgi:hypothetical protein
MTIEGISGRAPPSGKPGFCLVHLLYLNYLSFILSQLS